MSFKNPILGLSLYFIGVLLVAGGIAGIRFYATTIRDAIISVTAILTGASLIIYSNAKKRK
jgi:hypothetical protein